MTEYQHGEIVNITIKNARVGIKGVDSDPRRLYVDLGAWDDGVNKGREWGMTFPTTVESVTVERVAPAEWPPQPGDVWRDRHGTRWFATDIADYDEASNRVVSMVSQGSYSYGEPRPADALNAQYGPLTLVYREPVEGSGVSE